MALVVVINGCSKLVLSTTAGEDKVMRQSEDGETFERPAGGGSPGGGLGEVFGGSGDVVLRGEGLGGDPGW